MKPPQAYRGSEQTYVKHFFLERYLERVAYNIFSFESEFVYVDGFSGPWRSTDEKFKDTSFVIALDKLRTIKDGVRHRGKFANPRCVFIEKNPASFRDLQSAISEISDIEVVALQGEFQQLVPQIVSEIRRNFSFVFIDPTGWTGFDMRDIRPLIRLRGEVLINFMFDHINRFVQHPSPTTAATFNSLFGVQNWYDLYLAHADRGLSREDAIISVYMDRLRKEGAFEHVTCTRIKKPLSERSYFYLIYGTRHWKGILEFRKVEKKAVGEQEQVIESAKRQHQESRTGQLNLFSGNPNLGSNLPFQEQRNLKLTLGRALMISVLQTNDHVAYEKLLGKVLETPLVWQSDVNEWLRDLHKEGTIEITGMRANERIPKRGNLISWRKGN
jgi:three-Cys-motif partner protein